MLLIDAKMPKNCAECPCLSRGEYGAFEKSSCGLDNDVIISEKRRPRNCLLKEKKENVHDVRRKERDT